MAEETRRARADLDLAIKDFETAQGAREEVLADREAKVAERVSTLDAERQEVVVLRAESETRMADATARLADATENTKESAATWAKVRGTLGNAGPGAD